MNTAYNPSCIACIAGRQHTGAEWTVYHPLSRHGYTKEHGFSKAGLGFAGDEEKAERKEKGIVSATRANQ